MAVATERALGLLLSALLCGCSDGAPNGAVSLTPQQRLALAALRYDSGPPPADVSNRVADDRAAQRFGQRLFFDTNFSGRLLEGDNDGSPPTLGRQGEAARVSCAGCHLPGAGFVDTRSPHQQVSLGAQWTLRKSPQLLDVAFSPLYNWDGRRDALWNQALGVMESNREFNGGRLLVAQQLLRLHRDEYEGIFGELPAFDDTERFPQLTPETAGCVEVQTIKGVTFRCRGLPGDGADYDGLSPEDQALVSRAAANAAKAIAAYLRRLRCGRSRFDAWLDGDEQALDRNEQRGAGLFVGKAGCVPCHGGPRLTDDAFHNVGLSPAIVAVAIQDLDDRGAAVGIAEAMQDPTSSDGELSDGDREALPPSVLPEHEGAFRTPSLRCASGHPSFMHSAQLDSLEEVVEFFNRGGDVSGYPGHSELAALDLSESEQADLVAFLRSLDGPGPESELLTAEPP
jgi:cytochrome c peroxidase